MKYFKILIGVIVTVSLVGAGHDVAQAGDPIYVGKRVAGRTPLDQIDHAPWDALLRKYVDKDGYVNYTAWHASDADRQSLSRYLNALSQADPRARTSKDAKLAFWINAYNAVTVHGILREFPTTSIRNHTARLFGYNIWKDLQIYVGGKPYSLENIEHQHLRKMGEPRIHFAIVCASIGCPRLLNQAYTTSDVQDQLEANAKDFFSRRQNFRYDPQARTFHLSAILNWFDADFGAGKPAQLKTIAKWLPNDAARTAALTNAVGISYLDYNWNLNDQKSRRTARR